MPKRVTPAMEALQRKKTDKTGKYSFSKDAWKRFKRNKTAVLGLVLIGILVCFALFAGVICQYDAYEADYMALCQPPSRDHWFGTDNLGRDLFARCIYGTRWSLPIGLMCMVVALAGGGILGLIAAFFGKGTDTVIMRIMDVFQAIPGVLMSITVVAALGTGTWQLIIAIMISFMPAMSKTVRAAIFTVRDSEYIEAARCIGSGNLHLMLRHMLPNALGHIIIFAVGSIAAGIMIVSTLSYIGLGIQPPTPEWGALLAAGKSYISSYPYMVVFPGLMIMLTIFAFNLFGDGLRDALDPRLK